MFRLCLIHSAGFSLIELLIVVSLIGIMAFLAIPSFVGRSAAYRQDQAVSILMAGLESAKMQAISQDLDVEVEFSSTNQAFHSKADLNGNGFFDSGEINSLNLKGIQDITVVMPGSTGKFTALGRFSTADTRWLIQVQSAEIPTQYIYVFPSGHIQKTETIL